ncbi:hypothetical protein GCM10023191_000050 [Actinoallomurus oryzae]|uniref:RHS repeat protein n=1 Tax=Actinoallomurus oryzae TaxID=502180 RepID=A0ABP8P6S3_9ACTN
MAAGRAGVPYRRVGPDHPLHPRLPERVHDGRCVRFEYNDLLLPVTITDADGRAWRHEKDEPGNLTAATDPLGATTTCAYNGRGNLSAVRDAMGGAYRVRTDAAGLPVEIVDPAGAVTCYSSMNE